MESKTTDQNTAGFLRKPAYYTLLITVSLIMLSSAAMKFANTELIVQNFAKWKLTDWKNLIATAEILFVILYLIPRTGLIGLTGITLVLAGAIATHIQHQEPFYFPLAIVLVSWINFIFIKPKNQA